MADVLVRRGPQKTAAMQPQKIEVKVAPPQKT
jgi:hypothetical protein